MDSPPELRDLSTHLRVARLAKGWNQAALAAACGLSQAQISLFESGRRLPSLEQFIRLARALDVPFQRLLSGTDRPGVAAEDLAVELRRLGVSDLWFTMFRTPGAARPPEEVMARAVSGVRPDPRIVEAVPALLSWNAWKPAALRAIGAATRTTYRLAWLADVALAIDRQAGFPGGCRREPLERFVKGVPLPPGDAPWDDLGRPAEALPTSPIWRRWKIEYAGDLDAFAQRAASLAESRERRGHSLSKYKQMVRQLLESRDDLGAVTESCH